MTDNAARLTQFIDFLRHRRRLSAHTLDAYRRDIGKLLLGINDKPLAQVSSADIRRQLAADRKAHPSSLTRRLAAWRCFFDYLVEHDAAESNPAQSVPAPKTPPRLPKALTPDEVSSLLKADGGDWLALRDHAIFELFYSTALRLSELTALDLNDIDLRDGIVYVREGKGGRGRIAPIGAPAKDALNRWLVARQETPQQAQDALFINRRGGRLTNRAIQKRLQARALKLGYPQSLSPHMLRHSCASHFLQSSGDLRATQELLGHRNIASTQIYTRLDFQHLAKIYDQAHPRATKRKAESDA